MRGKGSFSRLVLPIALLGMAGVVWVLIIVFRNEGNDAQNDSELAVMDRVSQDQVVGYLRDEGVIDAKSKMISIEWSESVNQWLVITEQGKHEDGQPRYGHWFVDAKATSWSGSFCRH